MCKEVRMCDSERQAYLYTSRDGIQVLHKSTRCQHQCVCYGHGVRLACSLALADICVMRMLFSLAITLNSVVKHHEAWLRKLSTTALPCHRGGGTIVTRAAWTARLGR